MQLNAKISTLATELNSELANILSYWTDYTVDHEDGGFFGRINNENQVSPKAPKGSVLNARILWSFAAVYNLKKNQDYLATATRAYQYILSYFIDNEFGGVYWLVDHKGNPLDEKKQVYAIAFTIYGLSEYYTASGNEEAKETALKLYHTLVSKCYDGDKTGYFEAFARDWQPIDDLRLSAKDANEKKTMNTHLHVLEAYANLYKIWPDASLKAQIETLLDNFSEYFIGVKTNTLRLFFDENWNSKFNIISYGHDIEASWLLLESAEAIGDQSLINKFKAIAVDMAEKAAKGLDDDGGLWYEFENNHLVKEKHWWVQAEAMVGFYNAWQLSNDNGYLDKALNTWEFIKHKILNTQYGEWIWGIDSHDKPMDNEDKVGVWKCPYHNSRACMEIIKRVQHAGNL